MTTLQKNFQRTEQSTVVELYWIKVGSNISYYTSHNTSLYVSNIFHKRASITRSPLRFDNKLGKVSASLSTAIIPEVVNYISSYPPEPMFISIYRTRLDALHTSKLLIYGMVMGFNAQDLQFNVQLESRSKTLGRKIPRIVHQSFCNHDIFDSGCTLDEQNWMESALVDSIDGNDITFQYVGTPITITDYFVSGKVVFGGHQRLITGQTGNTQIQLHVPFDSTLEVGDGIVLFPGCRGNPDVCENVFNNKRRFLGMPLIPTTNPVLWGF